MPAFVRKALLFSVIMLVMFVAAMALPGQEVTLPGPSVVQQGISLVQPTDSAAPFNRLPLDTTPLA